MGTGKNIKLHIVTDIKYKMGLRWFQDFDDEPGEKLIEKATTFAKRGALFGFVWYGFGNLVRYEIEKHTPNSYPVFKFMKNLGARTLTCGLVGASLATGITLAQAYRQKNDRAAWGYGGLLAGSAFAVRRGSIGVGIECALHWGALFWGIKFCESYAVIGASMMIFLGKIERSSQN